MIAAVLADDFTGANDCAGSFAARGFRAFSARGDFFPAAKAEVYVRSLETRFLSGDQARRASRSAWVSLAGRGRRLNYQRIDSTLRGNAGEEIIGLLEALNARQIAFCAAFPQHGRVIRRGVVYVHGVRLDKSEYARDPLSPSRQARPIRLFPPGLAVEIKRGRIAGLRRAIRAAKSRVLCFDAVSDRDLKAIAKACLAEGIRNFAGSSGLSSALAQELRPRHKASPINLPARRAVLAGSVSQTTLGQLRRLESSAEAPWYELKGPLPSAAGRLFALSSLRNRAQMRRGGSMALRQRFADQRMRSLVRHGLRMGGGARGRLWLLTGGHCADLFFEALKLKGSWVHGMLLPGLPLLEAVGEGLRSRIWAASKPGGFGLPDVMVKFMRMRRWG